MRVYAIHGLENYRTTFLPMRHSMSNHITACMKSAAMHLPYRQEPGKPKVKAQRLKKCALSSSAAWDSVTRDFSCLWLFRISESDRASKSVAG